MVRSMANCLPVRRRRANRQPIPAIMKKSGIPIDPRKTRNTAVMVRLVCELLMSHSCTIKGRAEW